MLRQSEILCLFILCFQAVVSYDLRISNNGPVVLGATISFKAELLDNYGQLVPGTYCYKWMDNAMPKHTAEFLSIGPVTTWNVTFPKEEYNPGIYEVQVTVDKCSVFRWTITSARALFNITLLLNGNMVLEQNNSSLPLTGDTYVASDAPLTHTVSLAQPDDSFIAASATRVVSYWFVDCVYYGMSTNMSFTNSFAGASGQTKVIDTLVIVSYDNTTDVTTTTPPPTTTTTTPATTTSTTTAASHTNVTTTEKGKTTTISTTAVSLNVTTHIPLVMNVSTPSNSTHDDQIKSNDLSSAVQPTPAQPEPSHSLYELGRNYSGAGIVPFVCLKNAEIPLNPNNTYGYFSRSIKIRDPVENVSFVGTNWLKQGEMLNISGSCSGSGPFRNCVQMYPGSYNITGHETCEGEQILSDCRFVIRHYFKRADAYKLVVIISNDVSKKITPLTVNIYKVKKQPQLSVIIVPVTCSAAAVILIVFGIAYYIQSRNRYTIEVADFDFSQASDMEYKTFRERLREAMSNAINRTQDYVEEGNVWSPSRKYGSMQ
ncbi:uncharacterized protein LOC120348881 [Nilaparvata lugens]|uniref:uncharacterized protein LOC111043800 n=1 Tax=Nilaparvata lugens TaxID=108931 RepID=UPI000B99308D|nr:uncharacterized protein LOC111043800 [Nilaparvata lugens]XP_039290970.1 uncharacterized protein LOC120348881 [Nilaparvata lugens]